MAAKRRGALLALAVCLAAAAAAAAGAGPEGAAPPHDENCGALSDCGSCIRSPRCHWCASTSTEKSRCVHENRAIGSWCKGFSWGPKSTYTVIKNGTETSQLSPQHAKLQLRVGETKRINVTYKRLEDYPIDLYYLLDLSETMRPDKDLISGVGSELATAMKKVTKNFRLGFGSFVDKVRMPFVYTSPEKLRLPCPKDHCATPYSFKNHLPLNNNSTLFSEKLNATPVSTNNDLPEGGLDALMQVLVCTKKIKWRSDARHLLVFTTDSTYHLAGDGKLAGAVEPNPGICDLNEHNEYTGYADYDYPTISQINKKAIENKINIIFAVKQTVSQVYLELSQLIQGSRREILSKSSDNIVRIITEVYNKFEKSVKLLDDAGSQGIGIIYYSHCSENGTLIRTNECNNVKPLLPITFQIDITAKSCPSNLKKDTWETTINISPHGLNKRFKLELEVFCACPCEFPGHTFYKMDSPECSHQGTQKCGICVCNEMSTGENCECKRDPKEVIEETKLSDCMADPDKHIVCSGRGSCICGKCHCNNIRQNPEEIFYGKYCQCDNFSCKRHNGHLCSGAGRGKCRCGHCECEVGWTGDACECPEMQTGCVAPGEDKICSGFGYCKCGKCECVEERSGKYCGDCMQTLNATCPGGRCKEFADCVECMVHETGKLVGPLCSNCSIPNLERAVSISESALSPEERFCKVPDDAGCSFIFTYLEEPLLTVKAVVTKECPSSANLLGIVLGVSGTTLFLAILGILIWKLVTSIHDRREYAKYIQELENTTWAVSNNPEYQEPTTTTVNPTYHSRKSRFSFMMR